MIEVPSRVLCIIAHPDDLEPQAGGTLIRFVDAGARVHILNAVVPDLNVDGRVIPGAKAIRSTEAENAALALGATIELLYLQPEDLIHDQTTVHLFDFRVRSFAPELIISHHEVDTQQDHVVMAKIAQTVSRRNRIALWQLSHSFPGGYLPHRPQPNLFVDITSVYERKLASIRMYHSQRNRYDGRFENGWMETIKARDRYYGGMLNQDGLDSTLYAEGFVVSKMIWKEWE